MSAPTEPRKAGGRRHRGAPSRNRQEPSSIGDPAGPSQGLALLYAGLAGANLAAWAWAWAPFHHRPLLLGTAFLAWILGLRHAVDADHIAAIDNVVRKLMQSGGRPVTAGLWFSLGHSTVVVLATLAIAGAATAFPGGLKFASRVGGALGGMVSAGFLVGIGLVNLLLLRGLWRDFRRVRRGEAADDQAVRGLLDGRGFLARLLRPAFALITASWRMYPLGFLFGLGFDTATEVGLLGISAAQAAHGLSPWQVMVFPALFTAGMALVDTTDSVLMVRVYGWAFEAPLRRLWYNLTITFASVLVALLVGGIEALGLAGDRLALTGPFWTVIGQLNAHFEYLGFAVIGGFVLCWALSSALWRWRVAVARPE